MAIPATQNIFTDNLHAPPLFTAHHIIIASRPCSVDGFSCANDAEEVDSPWPRLTSEQVFVLEKQFMENNKPTTALRSSIVQTTGLSMQRVGELILTMFLYIAQNWFQNRRVKAKVQNRQQKLEVMQVLESACRRRITEPSSPTHHRSQGTAPQKAPKVTGRRRAKSDSATSRLSTTVTVHPVEIPNFSRYSPPSEASYASLARSLDQAAAAVRQMSLIGEINEYSLVIPQPALGGIPIYTEHDKNYLVQNVETLWQQPASAFSDWGSSRNSIAVYTPTPAGQLEDPFEFDNPPNSQTAQLPFDTHAPVQDDFNMFAAAIEMNQYNRPFVMPAFPTSGLMKRRQMSPLCSEPQNSSSLPPIAPSVLNGRDSCPSEFGDAFNTFNTRLSIDSDPIVQHSEVQSSLATRRKQACPTLLSSGPPSSRSKSFNGALPVMEVEEAAAEIKSMRWPILTEDDFDKCANCYGLATESSTFNLNIFNTSIDNENASPQLPPLSSPRDLQPLQDDEESCCSHTPRLKQEHIPELDFSDTSVTPESATFDNHMPSVTLSSDTYQIHLPEHRLYKHMGLPNYYDFPSDGSSASSGILLSKEANAFPFEEFLSARLNTNLDGAVDSQQSLVYPQFR
ncbi:hypothetical protein BGX38DRAFT_1273160 [Terfezia claveryi]|nr:hypothetical protein BGX38DRAFT_1273160 [Terfezia claveryi]